MDPIGAMSDRAGEENMHPSAAAEVVVMPLKIIPIVAYVLSVAVRIRSFTKVTPVASNGGDRLRASVSADTG